MITAVHRLLIDETRCAKNSWGSCSQICCRSLLNSRTFHGWLGRLRSWRFIASHTCSIGDKSRDTAGHGSTRTWCWSSKLVVTQAVCGRALSCWNIVSWPSWWRRLKKGKATASSTSSQYRCALRLPFRMMKRVQSYVVIPPHNMTEPLPSLWRSTIQQSW